MMFDQFIRQSLRQPVDHVNGNPLRFSERIWSMETVGKRIKAAREAEGVSRPKLAQMTGIPYSTLAEIENGRTKETARVAVIANALGWNALYLSEGKGQKKPDAAFANIAPGPQVRGKVPLISLIVAGHMTEVTDLHAPGVAEDWVDTTAPIHAHTYALRVKGDSMEPTFPAGHHIVVEPERDPKSGDFVIAQNGDDEATFKQLIKDGGDWYLKPLNPRYPVKPLGSARVIGVVVEVGLKF